MAADRANRRFAGRGYGPRSREAEDARMREREEIIEEEMEERNRRRRGREEGRRQPERRTYGAKRR